MRHYLTASLRLSWWRIMCVFVADIDNILHVNMLPHSDTSSWGHGARATLYPVTANSPPPWPRPPIGHCLLMSRLWLVESVSSPIPGLLWTQQLAEKLLVTFPLPWATILPRHHSVKLISRKSRIIIINLLSPRQTWACKNCFKNIFSYTFSWSKTKPFCDWSSWHFVIRMPGIHKWTLPPLSFLCSFREHDMRIFLPKIFSLGCSSEEEVFLYIASKST